MFAVFYFQIQETTQEIRTSFIASTSAQNLVTTTKNQTRAVKRKSKLKRQKQQQQQQQIETTTQRNNYRNSSAESSNVSLSSDGDESSSRRPTVLLTRPDNHVTSIEARFRVDDLESQREFIDLARQVNQDITSNTTTTFYKEVRQQCMFCCFFRPFNIQGLFGLRLSFFFQFKFKLNLQHIILKRIKSVKSKKKIIKNIVKNKAF